MRIDPEQVSALRNRAILYLQAGDGAAAEPLLRRVIGLRPGDAEQHRHLAIALEQSGDRRGALLEVKRARGLDASNAEAAMLESILEQA